MPHLSLIPFPDKVTETDGVFRLSSSARIIANSEAAVLAAELLSEYLSAPTGFAMPVCGGTPETGDIALEESGDDVKDASGFVKERYELSVTPETVSIRGLNRESLLSGIQTLRQLFPAEIYSKALENGVKWEIPCVEIADKPRYSWRGMMLDVARHFFTKEHVCRMIELFAQHKMNRVHLHLTDDQGWRIEIKKYPKLTEVGSIRPRTIIDPNWPKIYDYTPYGGFYTQDDIRQIVLFASRRGIELVPEIDMPGHMVAAIASYPEWGNYPVNKPEVRDCWGISYQILSPRESTISAMKDILDEVMELFPGKFVHVGGDEARKDEWELYHEVHEIMRKVGVKNEGELQSWFMKRINDHIVSRGRRMIGWDEILEGGLPGTSAVMCWRGVESGKRAALAGADVVAAYTSYTYFDYYQADPAKEPLAIGAELPAEYVYRFEPVTPEMTPEEGAKVMGGQGQLWSEYIPTPEHQEYMAFPRACALAEKLWTAHDKCSFLSFRDRLIPHRARLRMQNVNQHPLP